jgi:hypothetical protein
LVSAGWGGPGGSRGGDAPTLRSLFVEAGIAAASFTFSAAAIHAGLRLGGAAPAEGFYAFTATAEGAVEVYGESPAKPVFSVEFETASARAAALAASELRLPPDSPPTSLEECCRPWVNRVERPGRNRCRTRRRSRRPVRLWGGEPAAGRARRSTSRAMLIPTFALAAAWF